MLLVSGKYKPKHNQSFIVDENGKLRQITSSPYFPDQIVQWSIMTILEPIFMKAMDPYNLATIPGRGGEKGRKSIIKWLRSDPRGTKYCLQTDIHHFYKSIPHDKLKQRLLTKFKDKRVLKLLFSIIDCYNPGLPLGLYTSQWMANFFLTKLDHKIREKYHMHYYIRYMDDQIFFSSNKRKLHRFEKHLEKEVNALGLEIKPNWKVINMNKEFLDFLGFKFYRKHTGLRRRDFLHIKREAKGIGKRGYMTLHEARSMMSYWGWIKRSNSWHFYNKYVKPYASYERCQKVIRWHMKMDKLIKSSQKKKSSK